MNDCRALGAVVEGSSSVECSKRLLSLSWRTLDVYRLSASGKARQEWGAGTGGEASDLEMDENVKQSLNINKYL